MQRLVLVQVQSGCNFFLFFSSVLQTQTKIETCRVYSILYCIKTELIINDYLILEVLVLKGCLMFLFIFRAINWTGEHS